jgi:hypothetical protein
MTNETPPDGASHPAVGDRRVPSARKPRRPNRVVLQADVAADGRRNMSVEREGDDVVIRGHDRGPVVTRAWGPGTSEYEWAWRIPAASMPALLAALDGQPGDDALASGRARCTRPARPARRGGPAPRHQVGGASASAATCSAGRPRLLFARVRRPMSSPRTPGSRSVGCCRGARR